MTNNVKAELEELKSLLRIEVNSICPEVAWRCERLLLIIECHIGDLEFKQKVEAIHRENRLRNVSSN